MGCVAPCSMGGWRPERARRRRGRSPSSLASPALRSRTEHVPDAVEHREGHCAPDQHRVGGVRLRRGGGHQRSFDDPGGGERHHRRQTQCVAEQRSRRPRLSTRMTVTPASANSLKSTRRTRCSALYRRTNSTANASTVREANRAQVKASSVTSSNAAFVTTKVKTHSPATTPTTPRRCAPATTERAGRWRSSEHGSSCL